MKKFLILLGLSIGVIILGLAYLMFLIGFLVGDSRGCGRDSEAAIYAKSLSQDRLAILHRDMARYHQTIEDKFDYFYIRGAENIPDEFIDLEVVSVFPGQSYIKVEGCFDNYMYMYFKGIENQAEEKEIILSYGEAEAIEEKLWPK